MIDHFMLIEIRNCLKIHFQRLILYENLATGAS